MSTATPTSPPPEDDATPHGTRRRLGLRFVLGIVVGLVFAWLLGIAVALVPTRLPEPEVARFAVARARSGSEVTVSFVTTGTARVLSTRLHHGADLNQRDVVFRAAVITHPEGTLLFGTGVDPDGPPSRLIYNPFGHIDAVDIPALPEIDSVYVPNPRWHHLGGLERIPEIAEVPAEMGNGDFWQARRGPWPRRYGMHREGALQLEQEGRIRAISWQRRRYMGFTHVLDVFGDRSVMMVRLRGSTIDELGALVTLGSGDRILLVGDAVWTTEQVDELFPRPPWSTWLLDRNRMQLAGTIARLHLLSRDYGIRVIPMLDGGLELPEYPETW